MDSVDSDTVTSQITAAVAAEAAVRTDGSRVYEKLAELGYDHESVVHSVGEYVRGAVHTNGIESFWSMLKRGYIGVYHKMSAKRLHRYDIEFSGRASIRLLDTIEQMKRIAMGMTGKRLLYADLTA